MHIKEIQKRLNMISIFLEEVQKNKENNTLLSRIKSLQNFNRRQKSLYLEKTLWLNNNIAMQIIKSNEYNNICNILTINLH